MSQGNGSLASGSLRLKLKLDKAQPERSSALSSVRNTFEATLRPLFNNPELDNAQFLHSLHNILSCWIRYEHLILAPGSDSLIDILKAKGLYLPCSLD